MPFPANAPSRADVHCAEDGRPAAAAHADQLIEEMTMRKSLFAAAFFHLALGMPAFAGPAEEAQRIYDRFVEAQNAHDLQRVRGLLLDSPSFLWVTNGLSIWGAEAAVARLAQFHANEVWRIEAAQDRARAVEVAPGTAFLHIPLVLTVGSAAEP